MMLQGGPPDGLPVQSYVGSPDGKRVGSLTTSSLVEIPLAEGHAHVSVVAEWPGSSLQSQI